MEVFIILASFLVVYILVKMIIIDDDYLTPIIAIAIILFIFKPFTIVEDGYVTPNVIETKK